MYCKFCGAEIKETDKYCPYCGSPIINHETVNDVDTTNTTINTECKFAEASNNTQENPKNYDSNKKKVSPGKIILIVILACTLVQGGIIGIGFAVARNTNVSLYDIFSNAYDESFDDAFDKAFEKGYQEGSNNKNSNEKDYDTSGFTAGEIDPTNRSYSSKMTGLKFSLPNAWEVYTKDQMNSTGEAQSTDDLFVYDFYAKNSLSSSVMYISYYNKDYYSEYKNIEAFNETVKNNISTAFDKNSDDVTVDFADDSKIKLAGKDYNQMAVRITDGTQGYTYYDYEFTTEVNGYYVEISIISPSLEDVGTVLDAMA